MSDRYQIKSKIGSGGIGAVYRAFDTELKREVAIKRLLNQEHRPEVARKTAEYLINEAGLLSKLQHPNIVTVYDVGLDDEGAFIVMEFIDGETMSETVKRGALTLKDFVPVVEQSLEALVCAQEAEMLHRDIKPSNVMIRWLPSGRFQLKVLDFGLAKISEQPTLQTIDHGNSILGSIYFMSPEQLEREPLDQRTDLYSLGCLLYYTLAGAFPFKGQAAPDVMVAHLEHDVVPIHQIRPDIPAVVCDYIMCLMAFDRNDRPQDSRTALASFEAMMADLPNQGAASSATSAQQVQEPATATHEISAGRLLLTGTAPAPHPTPLNSTTDYFQPPLKKQRSNWFIPVAGVAALVFAALWMVLRDNSSAKATDTPDPPELIDKTIEEKPTPKSAKSNSPDVLIPFGAEWQYLEPGETPSKNWNAINSSDTRWKSGKAPIGYGDKLATDIGNELTKTNKKPVSLYFRREFKSDRANMDKMMDLRMHYDDGAILFLNGYELRRMGLPSGEITANTLATRVANDDREQAIQRFGVDRTELRNGLNVLAVRLHQSRQASTDSHFDLELRSQGGVKSPKLPEPAKGYKEVLSTAMTDTPDWKYRFSQPTGLWEKEAYSTQNWKNGKGLFMSAESNGISEILKARKNTEWTGKNIWLRRHFELTAEDIAAKEHLFLKVLHDDDITIFINEKIAAERNGYTPHHILLPISEEVRKKLKVGRNIIAVHCLNLQGPAFVDVGIVRKDLKK